LLSAWTFIPTPTYFVNGRKVVGNRPYEYLKQIIDEELKNVTK